MFRAIGGDDETVVLEGEHLGSLVRAVVGADRSGRPVVEELLVSPATARVLRTLSLGEIVRAAARETFAARLVGMRTPTADERVRDVARRYAAAATRRRDPLVAVAEETGLSRNQVRALVWRAREQGLLSSMGRGIAGGSLAQDLLLGR